MKVGDEISRHSTKAEDEIFERFKEKLGAPFKPRCWA
jgi:hypothetical protein